MKFIYKHRPEYGQRLAWWLYFYNEDDTVAYLIRRTYSYRRAKRLARDYVRLSFNRLFADHHAVYQGSPARTISFGNLFTIDLKKKIL
jgi:hypothetical protein